MNLLAFQHDTRPDMVSKMVIPLPAGGKHGNGSRLSMLVKTFTVA